jgi:agmatine deiminase
LKKAQEQVVAVAKVICNEGGEDVYMLCKDEEDAKELRRKIGQQQKIHIHLCDSDDTWIRDTGPTCCWDLETNELVGVDWNFNAYGGPEEGCYWPCDKDKKISKSICDNVLNIKSHKVPIILEGGSIHTDGEETLLVTEECLLNPNRNPHLSKEEIQTILKKSLGVDSIIWLPNGLDADEDTNGHVDNFCCFLKPGHVILAWTDDEKNDLENYSRCRAALSYLMSCKDAKGRSMQVHKLYLPPPLVRIHFPCATLTINFFRN